MSFDKNPFHVGDLVRYNDYHELDDIIWRVVLTNGERVRMIYAFCLNKNNVPIQRCTHTNWRNIDHVNLIDLCAARASLDILINEYVNHASEDETKAENEGDHVCCAICTASLRDCKCSVDSAKRQHQ